MNPNPPRTPSKSNLLNPLRATYPVRSSLKSGNTLNDMQSEERRKAVEIMKINAELQEARASMDTYKKQFHLMAHDINKRNDIIRQMMVDKELLAKQCHDAVEYRKHLEMTKQNINKERMAQRREFMQLESRFVEQARLQDRIINEKQERDAQYQELETSAKLSQAENEEKLRIAQQKVYGLKKLNEDQEMKIKQYQQEKVVLIEQWKDLKQAVEESKKQLSEKSQKIQTLAVDNEKSDTDISNLNADVKAINRSLVKLSSKLQSLPDTIDVQVCKRMGEFKQEIVQEMSAQFAVMMEGMKKSLLEGMGNTRKQTSDDDEEKYTHDVMSQESDGATSRKRHIDSPSSSSSNSVLQNPDTPNHPYGSNVKMWNGHF